MRTVAPLCDQRTEAVLGVTFEHTKRQEITTSVSDHIPRPAVTAVTGSEATDSAALAKAQKLLNTIHATSEIVAADPGAYVNAGASDTAPSVKVDGWIESNSAPRTTSVKFNRDSYGAGATPSSPKRRQSTYSSSKVKFGFWAEAEAPQSSDSSGGYSGSEEEDGRRAGGSAGAVSRGTSRGTASRGGTAGAPGSAAGRRERHRDRAVAVHSLTSTACYVSLYYRYLKKFPNLNFRRDNPRLEQIGGDPHRQDFGSVRVLAVSTYTVLSHCTSQNTANSSVYCAMLSERHPQAALAMARTALRGPWSLRSWRITTGSSSPSRRG